MGRKGWLGFGSASLCVSGSTVFPCCRFRGLRIEGWKLRLWNSLIMGCGGFSSSVWRGLVRMLVGVGLLLGILGDAPLLASNWLPFGPDGGDARRIVPDPENHTHLYLGTVNGWIYESHDTGASWHRLARVAKRDDLVLDSIVVDAGNPRHLIVGAWVIDHPDGGLYVSHDAGKTWVSQAEMRGQSIRALRASPTDPKELVAGTLKGVFRSTDGGARWKLISPLDSTEIHEVQSVAIDPADPNVIYAGTWHLPWKTTDGGEHWENIKDGIIEDSDVFSIIVDPVKPKIVYASACSGIYKSEDAGSLFHKVQGIPSSARRTRVLMQDPNDLNIVFAGTTEGLFRSNDAGKTWNRTTGPEVIVNDVLVDKSDSKHVLLTTNRGGVLSSEDGGDTFQASNAGFSARQILAIQRDRRESGTVLVGVVNDKEWGGVFRSTDGGLSWLQRSEGLQGRDVFALGQAPDGTFIAGTAHGLFRFDQDSQVWVKVENAPTSAAGTTVLAAEKPRGPLVAHHATMLRHVGSHPVSRSVLKKRKPSQRKAALAQRKAPKTRGHASSVRQRATLRHHAVSASHTRPMVLAELPPAAPTGETSAAKGETAAAKGETGAPKDTATALPAGVVGATPVAAGTTAGTTSGTAGPVLSSGGGFNGPVYGLTTSGDSMLAITSLGLMTSSDNGLSWTLTGPERSEDWRYLASAKTNVVSASLHNLSFSADSGKTWGAVLLPEGLTQVAAVSVEPSGAIWVGGREGIFVTKNGGNDWTTPKNLFVNTVNSIYFDEASSRMIVTTGSYGNIVFLVQVPSEKVSFADSGWNLRFARPMGDHLIAATLYDGIVVQPQMVATPMQGEMIKPTGLAESPSQRVAPLATTPSAAASGEVLRPNGVPVVEPVHLPTSPN
jgi:photosystem II stability/assembly factor-like uncharacterized protein